MQNIRIAAGNASLWRGEADAVFTHPYAPLPACLHGKPTILNLYEGRDKRQTLAEGWIGAPLQLLGTWGNGLRNSIYVAHLPVRKVDIVNLIEDPFEPGSGWFPLQLPLQILGVYADLIRPGMTVWDGFMGRGTVGRACQELGLSYVGLDIAPARVALAREFLGI
jgi:hypothetical protein